jgi:hypothetical protein
MRLGERSIQENFGKNLKNARNDAKVIQVIQVLKVVKVLKVGNDLSTTRIRKIFEDFELNCSEVN